MTADRYFDDTDDAGYYQAPGSGEDRMWAGPRRVSPNHLCPACGGVGLEFYNETRDPATGGWERDERDCSHCNGTGLLVAT